MGRKPHPSTWRPSFVKVMFGDFSEHLKIPPAFVKHFDGALPKNFMLNSPATRARRVDVKRLGNNSFFGNGWKLFVRDNSLEFGDFLVFEDVGNAELNVTIFGKNGCEKEVPTANRKSSKVIYIDSDCASDENGMSSPQDLCESEEFQPLEELTCGEREGSRSKHVAINSSRSSVRMETQGKARALQAANAFTSEHPFFKIVMKKSHLRKGDLTIRESFVKRYIKEVPESVTLWVSNRSWASWPVELSIYSDYSGKLGAGSLAFVRDNTLTEGDVCIFELIRRDDLVLKVSIFRCIG